MIVCWRQWTKSYYFSSLCPSSPVSALPQHVYLGRRIPHSLPSGPFPLWCKSCYKSFGSNILLTALPTAWFRQCSPVQSVHHCPSPAETQLVSSRVIKTHSDSAGGPLVIVHSVQSRSCQAILHRYLESSVPVIYPMMSSRDQPFFFYVPSYHEDMFTKRLFSK